MAKTRFSKPLIFQSKLLCFSLLYLSSSLLLALRFTLSATKCTFRSSPYDPIQSPLFYYPSSYGEHKHATPTSRPSCDSPLYFSDYWDAVREMQELLQNSTDGNDKKPLRYVHEKAETFGGNLSVEARMSYYDRYDESVRIPCGFFKSFPISSYDQTAMESCRGLVVVSAVFNDHDKIRQPRGLGSKTLDFACFFMFVDGATLDRLHHHNLLSRKLKERRIGAWRIVRVSAHRLYENPAMNGVIPKYLTHRLFPNAKYSIWADAKLQIAVDPILLIHSLIVREGADVAVSKHPFFVHTMEEAVATSRWKKWWDVDGLKLQMETYCENGLQPWSSKKPYPSDVPDSALILRKHTAAADLFSCLLFNELDGFNPRDQLAFAYVRDRMNPKVKMNMFEVEVFEQVAIEYRHNIKQSVGPRKVKRASSSSEFSAANGSCSKCEGYLLKMWGEESHD